MTFVYIATSRNNVSKNIFKFGKTNCLLKMLDILNEKKNPEDKYYYCFFIKVYRSEEIEEEIFRKLYKFTYHKEGGLFLIYYPYFLKIVKRIVYRINELYEILHAIKKNIITINNLKPISFDIEK